MMIINSHLQNVYYAFCSTLRRVPNLRSMASFLPHHPQDEQRITDDVALPQPARVAAETIQPFQAIVKHPARPARLDARHEIKQRTHRPDDRHIQLVPVSGDPPFLDGRAHADEQDVWMRRVHRGDGRRSEEWSLSSGPSGGCMVGASFALAGKTSGWSSGRSVGAFN